MIRGYHRHRSVVTWSVWAGAFLFLCAFLAWRFQWLPGSGSSSPVEENVNSETNPPNPKVNAPPNVAESVPKLGLSLLKQQSEPENPFDEPPRLAGNSRTKKHPEFSGTVPHMGIGGSIPRAGSNMPVGLERTPTTPPPAALRNQNNEPYVPKGTASGIRQIGYEKPANSTADSEPPVSKLAEIDRLITQRDYIAAHKELSKIYWNKPEWRSSIRRRIEMTARTIYFSPQPHFLRPYVVQYGDHLRKIAPAYKLSWQYLATLNEIPLDRVDRIRPNQKLKVMKGPFSAVVDLSDREITIHHYRYFVCRYRIGIGKDSRTPIGTFKVKNKVIDPEYTGLDETGTRRVRIPGGAKTNPLGSRWLDLGDGYGIHGTIDPDSIGKAESRGCVRMLNTDVEQVYDLLTVGSEVIIQP